MAHQQQNQWGNKQSQSNALAVVKQANVATVQKYLTEYKDQIQAALPRHLTAERMARMALTELRTNPKLQECDPLSFFGAIIKSAQLGLEIGLIGEAYLIPRKIKGKMEVCFQPGYRGLRKLARNNGDVANITSHVVYEHDEYDVSLGSEERIHHKPKLVGPRGEKLFGYAVIRYRDGSSEAEVMHKDDILHVRDEHSESYKNYLKSPTWPDGNPKDPPAWITDEAEMWRKTLVIRACKRITLSPELASALAADVQAETGRSQGLTGEIFGRDGEDDEETYDMDPIDLFWTAMETRGIPREDDAMSQHLSETAGFFKVSVEEVMSKNLGDEAALDRFVETFRKKRAIKGKHEQKEAATHETKPNSAPAPGPRQEDAPVASQQSASSGAQRVAEGTAEAGGYAHPQVAQGGPVNETQTHSMANDAAKGQTAAQAGSGNAPGDDSRRRRRANKFTVDPAVFGVPELVTCGCTPDQYLALNAILKGDDAAKALEVKKALGRIGHGQVSFFRHDEAEELLRQLQPAARRPADTSPEDTIECIESGEQVPRSHCLTQCPTRLQDGFCPAVDEVEGGII